MTISRPIILAVAVLALGTAWQGCRKESPKVATGPGAAAQAQPPGSTSAAPAAPEWKLKDLAGNEVSSEQFKGKVMIVDFWATWCGLCVSEIPGYVELQKKYGKDGLVIVGISLDRKSPAFVQKFAQDHDMNYTLVMGSDDTVEAFGGFNAIPTTFLINRDGNIVNKKTGAVPHDEYEAIVKKYL